MPLTPNAKIDRTALPTPDQAEAGREEAFVPPKDDLESTIAAVWQEALNVPQVGMNDNFFELGGHSLLMVQVQHKLRGMLNRELAITDLFRFPTIRSLTLHLRRDADDASALQQGVERAEARKELMNRRRQLRQMIAR
jgi:hypothetical protein